MTIRDEAKKLEERLQEEQNRKVKICLFGQPGAGKSSLINQLVGSKVAVTGPRTDVTEKAQVIEWEGLVLVDLPGYGTSNFPPNKWFTNFDVDSFDLYLCVFSGKFHEADTKFFRELSVQGKVCLFVRNFRDALWEDGKSEAEIESEVVKDVARQVGSSQKVYFTSCRGVGQGIGELSSGIFSHLDEAKRFRWARDAKAYSAALLAEKRKACERDVYIWSGVSAANALNPIPGADIAVDFTALITLFNSIRSAYGLSPQKLDALTVAVPSLKPIIENVLKTATSEGVKQLLRQFVGREVAKSVSKYVPIVGQAIAASIGFSITLAAGTAYLDDCHRVAEEILERELVRASDKQGSAT